MGKTTGIHYLRSTLAWWIGCEKVGADCANCWAETLQAPFAKRAGVPALWGPGGVRMDTSAGAARQAATWQREQHRAWSGWHGVSDIGHKPCPGPWLIGVNFMSDFFEDRDDLDPLRARFRETAAHTPLLSYLLLTKRPADAVARRWPWPGYAAPTNVGLGVSIGRAEYWPRLDVFRAVAAGIRWVSAEPLIGDPRDPDVGLRLMDAGINWLVIGGESDSPRSHLPARPMDLEWARYLIRRARLHDIPVYVKQLGSVWARNAGASDRAGGDPAEWPADLRIREFPISWGMEP